MAQMILILGDSGTGKSSSLRNFKKGEASVISCAGKLMPFKSDLAVFTPKTYTDVYSAIDAAKAPVVVIDDANFLMASEEFARAKETGYVKFTDMALHLENIFRRILAKDTNQRFYVLAHPEDRNDGDRTLRFKISAGKMSSKFPIGARTNVVLETAVDGDGNFVFKTKTDGLGVKSPIGMFDKPAIENDLKLVDQAFVNFYK